MCPKNEASKISGGWLGYNELAWTEALLAGPDEVIKEAAIYLSAIEDNLKSSGRAMLHLGCGAGMHDYIFKRTFRVTGVDISGGMLEEAAGRNPEVKYVRGDMRTVRLGEKFDVVVAPDSIGYMTTREELKEAVDTARIHLKKKGVLLIAALIEEDFRENNFVYKGGAGDLKVTVFENNDAGSLKEGYEAAIVYLVRCKGELNIYHEKHTLGLFNMETWLEILEGAGFEASSGKIQDLYKDYVSGEGDYVLTMFVCRKA